MRSVGEGIVAENSENWSTNASSIQMCISPRNIYEAGKCIPNPMAPADTLLQEIFTQV